MSASTMPAETARTVSIPLTSDREERLELVPGASRLTLHGRAPGGELVRASFEGRRPAVDASDGKVVVRYPRLRGLTPRRDAAEVALSSAVPWTVCVRGGASKMHADMRDLELAAIEIGGGASEVELILPRPRGTVRIRVQGGASRMTVSRLGDVAVRLRIGGGASKLSLDGQQLGSAGGEVRLETPGWHDAADRYELEVAGGVSRLTVAALDDGVTSS